jgi:hypothetical protein
MYLWQASGVCLLGHFQNLFWQGNPETSKDFGQRCGHLGTLKNGLPLHAVPHHLQVLQGMENRPPRLLATDLGRPFQQQRQHTELHMGDDPMEPPMIDRTRLQPRGLHPPEAPCDQDHAGVPQRDILRVQGVVVGRHHELAIILRFRGHLRRVEAEAALRIHPQVTPAAARGHQLTGFLGVIHRPRSERRKLRPNQLQKPLPMGVLPRRRRPPSPAGYRPRRGTGLRGRAPRAAPR